MGEEFKISDDINWKLLVNKKAQSSLKSQKEIKELLDKEFNYLMDSQIIITK